MKQLTVILFLIFTGCKSKTKPESKNEDGMATSVQEMWNDFTESKPEFKTTEIPDAGPFHNNEADAKRLADLIVSGKKKAGSGLYLWYKEAKADLPKIGTKNMVTDFDGKARAIIETTKVDTIPFNQISTSYAEKDMGTTIEPLKKWKKAHWDFFESALKESGATMTEDILIVCEEFKTIWPEQ